MVKKTNKTVLDYLVENDKEYRIEGNIFYAEKAFMVRSLVTWCLDKREIGHFDEKSFESCLSLVDRYVRNEVELEWQDDCIMIKEMT